MVWWKNLTSSTQSPSKQVLRFDSCNNKMLSWKILFYLPDEISTEEGINLYPYNVRVTQNTDTYFWNNYLPMLNILFNHRTSKSICTLFPSANVKITKGLTITFYNYIIFASQQFIKNPYTTGILLTFFFQIVRSNTAKTIIYNSQMTNMQTKIFATKQGKCQISL